MNDVTSALLSHEASTVLALEHLRKARRHLSSSLLLLTLTLVIGVGAAAVNTSKVFQAEALKADAAALVEEAAGTLDEAKAVHQKALTLYELSQAICRRTA